MRKKVTRRQFFRRATAALVAPYFVPSSILGKTGAVSPSNKITIACIGMNWMGPGNMNAFLKMDDTKVVAVCDVDRNHLMKAKGNADKHYGNEDCAAYEDFREVMVRDDIDAVMLALPDHWHAPISIAAAKSGKDIYGEKPLSHRLKEGRAMVDTVSRYGRIWQTGSWQRSVGNFRRGCELVRNGRIGTVHTVEVGLPSGYYGRKDETFKEPPGHLNYDFWLGPAPVAPYCEARVHVNWRWHLDYGGGQLMDWIGHHCDIGHWGLGGDDKIGPLEIEGTGEFATEGVWNAATKYYIAAKYPNNVDFIIAGGHEGIHGGTRWIGTDGWVQVNRGHISAHPKSLLDEKMGAGDIQLFKSPGHQRNFIDCVKSRKQTLTPAEVAHRSASAGHLGLISILTGRKLKWNAETEEIIGDPGASRLLSKPMRSPWKI